MGEPGNTRVSSPSPSIERKPGNKVRRITDGEVHELEWVMCCKRRKHLPGVRGGETQLGLVQSRLGKLSSFSALSVTSLLSKPSRPENMGFNGVCKMSQLPGLLMTLLLLEDDSGGVDG
jgi:hypothetical protein